MRNAFQWSTRDLNVCLLRVRLTSFSAIVITINFLDWLLFDLTIEYSTGTMFVTGAGVRVLANTHTHTHMSADTHLATCDGTSNRLRGVQPTGRMFSHRGAPNLSSSSSLLLFGDTSCWNNESRCYRALSVVRQITLTAGGRHFSTKSDDDISCPTRTQLSVPASTTVKWTTEREGAREREKEHELVFDSHNWLGQMSTFSSMYTITLLLIIGSSRLCAHVQISSTTCSCLMPLFTLSTFSLSLFSPPFRLVRTADDLQQQTILFQRWSILEPSLL